MQPMHNMQLGLDIKSLDALCRCAQANDRIKFSRYWLVTHLLLVYHNSVKMSIYNEHMINFDLTKR